MPERIFKLDKEHLNNVFEYKDGELYWKVSMGRRAKQGNRAGYVHNEGYRVIGIGRKQYEEHRIIWVMHYDVIPYGMQIDHKDRNRLNNKIDNLRLASNLQNSQNRSKNSNNTTGFHRVVLDKRINKYFSRIKIDGKEKFLGYYDTPEAAYNAYVEAEKKYYGQFSKFN